MSYLKINSPSHTVFFPTTPVLETICSKIAYTYDYLFSFIRLKIIFLGRHFTGLILQTLGPFNVFILLNGWICLHGELDEAGCKSVFERT